MIVTDTTPNDGVLDDDIDTIQLVGTSLTSTYVTGNVIASNKVPIVDNISLEDISFSSPNAQGNASGTPLQPSSGVIKFNELIDLGVKSIELNGFDLSDAGDAGSDQQTGVFLYGGVGVLSFDGINAQSNTAVNPTPYQIVIGEANTPLKVKPSIYLNQYQQLGVQQHDAVDSANDAVTTPSVQFMINGVVRNFDMIAATDTEDCRRP